MDKPKFWVTNIIEKNVQLKVKVEVGLKFQIANGLYLIQTTQHCLDCKELYNCEQRIA